MSTKLDLITSSQADTIRSLYSAAQSRLDSFWRPSQLLTIRIETMSSIEIDCQSVKSRLDSGENFLLLDCREQNEWDHVHIEGATLLPMSEIQDRVGELDAHRGSDVIVHCHHGGRSLQVAMWLQQQGFSSVFNMSGGIDVWAQQIDSSLPRY